MIEVLAFPALREIQAKTDVSRVAVAAALIRQER
jgi:hypothetical protein